MSANTVIVSTHRIEDLLRSAGLQVTPQRLALATLLFAGKRGHTTADMLYAEASTGRQNVSLATVYNTLQTFVRCGLVRSIAFQGSIVFDTNIAEHHHFVIDGEHRLLDIPCEDVMIERHPNAPDGYTIARVELQIHLVKHNVHVAVSAVDRSGYDDDAIGLPPASEI